MGLRAQLGWIRHGATRTAATFAAFEGELRDLQNKVEALTGVVARLDGAVAELRAEAGVDRADLERAQHNVDAMKTQLRTVTDDLGDRVGAVVARLDAM